MGNEALAEKVGCAELEAVQTGEGKSVSTSGATRGPLTRIQLMFSVTAAATRTMQRTTKTIEAV